MMNEWNLFLQSQNLTSRAGCSSMTYSGFCQSGKYLINKFKIFEMVYIHVKILFLFSESKTSIRSAYIHVMIHKFSIFKTCWNFGTIECFSPTDRFCMHKWSRYHQRHNFRWKKSLNQCANDNFWFLNFNQMQKLEWRKCNEHKRWKI